MENRIDKFTIVGGGSAGWFTAAILLGALNRRNDGPDTEITLIESPGVPVVGVGEATTLSTMVTFAQLRIDEKDFLKKCDGSLKSAVRFRGWDVAPDGSAGDYYHPFDSPPHIYGFPPAYHYHRRGRRGVGQPSFAHSMSVLPALLDRNRAPRPFDSVYYEGVADYAFHLDAVLLGRYLREYCTSLGVTYVSDDVIDVTRDGNGLVTALELERNGTYPVEFVIDCTGFAGLIVRNALGEPFVPYGNQLLCDRAAAVQLPHAEGAPLEPYTTSTALSAGWAWSVPLYSRRGTGYVYASGLVSDDQAIDELLRHLGAAGAGAEPRVIAMNVGRLRRSWVDNCLAVGLSAGFVEPLESTAIHLIQTAIRRFVDHLPGRVLNTALIDRYNRLTTDMYDDIRDFIMLHYCTSNRDDSPFWRAARHDVDIPETVKGRLELWRHKLPSALDIDTRNPLFTEWSYLYVLFGKGFFDGVEFPAETAISDADYDEFLAQMADARDHALSVAPDHRELLDRIHAEHIVPWYRPEPVAYPEQAGDG